MKKLGIVKNVIHDGTILLRAAETPTPGSRVYDLRGVEVGRVARVFGPVNEPYVSLKPKPKTETMALLGTTLYLGSEEQASQDRPQTAGRRPSRVPQGKFRPRSPGPAKKKGGNKWQRKENPRKK